MATTNVTANPYIQNNVVATSAPDNSLSNLGKQYGLNVTYDKANNTVNVVNPTNNKTVSFTSGQGANYGVGGFQNGYNMVTDTAKFQNALGLTNPNVAPTYTSQYQPQLDDITKQLQSNLTQQYQSPYQAQLQNIATQLQNRMNTPFVYDSSNDQAYQQASKNVSQQIMENMNDRGILNSTVTENQVQQGLQDLQGQYYDKAYQRYQQDNQNLYNMASFLQTLDSDAYNRNKDSSQKLYDMATFISNLDANAYNKYKDSVDMYYKNKELEYQQQQDAIANERNKVNDAWARVQNIGYVDNAASIVLGVPVGTLSYDAAKEKRQREQALSDYERQLKDQRENTATDYKNQQTLLAQKQKYDVEMYKMQEADKRVDDATAYARQQASASTKTSTSKTNMYDQAVEAFADYDAETVAKNLSDNKKEYVSQLGTANYNKLLKESQDQYYQERLDMWANNYEGLKKEIKSKPDYYKQVLGIVNYNKIMALQDEY